jgi:pimeloyl-CoA dehydrogenase
MNFEIDDDQRALQDSLERLLASAYGFEQRRAIAVSKAGHSPPVWRQLAELGITGLPLPSAHGGFGGGAIDLLPVMQSLGRVLSLEPLLATCVLGATALRLAGSVPQQQALFPAVADGRVLLAWAHDEAGARHARCWTETRASQQAGGWLLHGAKTNVLHAEGAHYVVVSARLQGEADDTDGRALFLVDAGAPGLALRAHRLVDDTPAGALTLTGVPAQPLGDPLDSRSATLAVEGTLDAGIAAACADMLGTMEAAFKLAMGYLTTRKQFGRAIGENQALRHKAAEMLVSLETCRSMATAAAIAVDRPHDEDSAADLVRAKLLIGRHARHVCQQAIQLHGGIGMTEEYAVGHCLRRVHVLDNLFGDSGSQAARLAEMIL